jgi:membrane associated rhomboid family serine protease
MFLPLKTQGYDGRPRPGLIGILLICLLMQLWAWHGKSKRAAAVAILKYGGTPSCAPGKVSQKVFETAEDFGILKTAGMRIDRPAIAVNRLEQMRKASAPYRAGLVADRLNPLNFLTSLFIHAGWIHLIFTLWFLFLAGTTLEKHWGTGLFLGIFLACGILGGLAYLIAFGSAEKSAGFALLGPNGSMGGLMAAFAITQWNSRVTLLDFVFGPSRGPRDFPAQRILLAWAALELLTAFLLPGRGGLFALTATLTGGLAGLALGACLPGRTPGSPAYAKA